jgi:hypothetical protein
MNPSVNFIDLARAARSLPEMTTSQPFAPDSMTKRRTPYAALARADRVSLRDGRQGRGRESEGDAPTDGKPTKELVTQRLALCDGGETTVEDLFGVELKRALGELEPLLDERCKLANTLPLLSQHFLCVRCADDNLFCCRPPSECQSIERSKVRGENGKATKTTDLGTSMCHADFTSRVALLCEFAGEKLAQFSAEDTIGDKLSLLADCSGHYVLFFTSFYCSVDEGRLVFVE